jgi:myo-inositol-1(or 4)-monophosphatase
LALIAGFYTSGAWGIVRAMHPTLNIAIRAARSAGRILMRSYERIEELTVETKSPNDFVSEVDRGAEAAIVQELRSKFPDHAILGEEGGQQGGRSTEFEWLVDPLDGTTNYLHGFPQFSISIAMKYRGQLEHGLVYDPLREELFTATRGRGAHLNDRRLRVSRRPGIDGALLGTGIPFRDQAHVDTYLGMLKALLADSAGVRRPGSAALDFAYVAAGRLDGFWELGLSPWDIAAGALLIAEAGGTVSDLAGGNRYLDTGNVVAGNLKLHAAMLQRIRPFLGPDLRA